MNDIRSRVEARADRPTPAGDVFGIGEKITVEVFRSPEPGYVGPPDEMIDAEDLVVNAGRSFLAQRIGANVNSPMAHMAVGSGSTGAALGDTALVAETVRKALAVNSAQANNVYTTVATFGGAADSVTSVPLVEAGIFNHASSGEGTMFQRVTFAAVTLANSDILRVQIDTNVGSNDI